MTQMNTFYTKSSKFLNNINKSTGFLITVSLANLMFSNQNYIIIWQITLKSLTKKIFLEIWNSTTRVEIWTSLSIYLWHFTSQKIRKIMSSRDFGNITKKWNNYKRQTKMSTTSGLLSPEKIPIEATALQFIMIISP